MSKFKVGDHVRVTDPKSYVSDQVGVICRLHSGDHSRWIVDFNGALWGCVESTLTLADPDVHTVLDQMDAESAPAAFKVGERVMVRGHVGSYGGRFGMIHGREVDSTTQWLVRLDGNPVTMPFSGEELTSPHMPSAPFDNDLEPDPVSAPSHYRSHPSGIETITITKHESFLRGNVLKYVLRAPYKGSEIEDLKKAAQYLQWEIDRAEAAQ
ncbi:hypothetical protein ART_1591 [Arthrobacter sp. PAMC 25486]|uniref:DUF3310 domain-containing protein n=1 Tax=Arthrobacter sp. PAMC 25486 TaxID=1494608 RepID=UPI000535A8BB|nr:DUF3310 domain-containing protein [Arthrobacter sp. PAMC 25486]AIY01190.1 hypothetical protein ART_1591 [Arthrobacter sp. PAMC 25486]